ncbi:single-stranded DNA-binding protein [Lacticaseibacillus suibinensis]|uniref:single-stranded DNA-binding protein n=1 Tax=Lacticaseibacillus suibinensis TaxID=2486011 RepID=UPI00194388D0|nr:single-stranded DNA-binding protein [Lacticaseibacillus suibinensis]
MINSLALTGRLTRELDLRYTQSGTAVGTFTLAVDRQFTNSSGERETDFINCVIWRKSAENFVKFTRKGSLVGVEGHIQTRNYDNNQGQRVYVTEVVVENFALFESKNAQAAPDATNQPQTAPQQTGGNSYVPQPKPAQTAPQTSNEPFASNGKSVNISDSDLPF